LALPKNGGNDVLHTNRDGNSCKDEIEERYLKELPDLSSELAEYGVHSFTGFMCILALQIKSMKLSYVAELEPKEFLMTRFAVLEPNPAGKSVSFEEQKNTRIPVDSKIVDIRTTN